MSSAKKHGVINNIKKFLTDLLRSSPKNVTLAEHDNQTASAGTKRNNTLDQETSAPQNLSEQRPPVGQEFEEMDQWFNSTDDENQKPSQREVYENTSQDNLVTGGFYAVQEQENGPYQFAQVIYVEEQIVHVLCFAERLNQLPPQILQQNLTTGLNKEDSSFGIEHLPLPKADFAAHALFLGQRPLTDQDLLGYQVYVDSVFDCLDEQAPDWLKKAGSYAAWRYDRNAMAALADRYLIGVDLPRDSKKSFYWLNRLVYAGRDLVQAGEAVDKEEQILTGGIYACPQKDGKYQICKVVLKDKHGVQQLTLPFLLDQLSENVHPIQAVEQALTGPTEHTAKPPAFSHVSRDASGFLEQSLLFLGLLPVTIDELHCYRAHLRKMFDGAEFQTSAWEILLNQASAGEFQAQTDVAYRYLDSDPLWEVQQNIPEAIRWLTEAANQGHGLAAYNLATLFQEGKEDVTADPQLGFEWMTYAAQLNYGLAQLHIAESYQQGKDCAANPALAHAWYSLAVLRDNDLPEEAKKRAKQRKYELEGTCSDEQLAEAKQYFLQLQKSS